jgi:ribosome-associated protein
MSVPIPSAKLAVRYSRSGGPGGQNVNKVETKVEVRLALSDLDVSPAILDRIRSHLHARLTAAGEIIVASSRHRLRSRNLRDCLDRLQSLLDAAARPPVPRIATAPTRGSQQRRIDLKRRQSRRKLDRRRPDED